MVLNSDNTFSPAQLVLEVEIVGTRDYSYVRLPSI